MPSDDMPTEEALGDDGGWIGPGRDVPGPWDAEPDAKRGPAPVIEWERPFARLALAHTLSVGGDAVVAIALANSLFFSIDPSESRWRILAYLIFTMAPFAIVSPFLGPLMDRIPGGHRLVMIVSTAGRFVAALLMAKVANGGLLLFPEAFLALVLGKTYAVAKSSIVPSTVSSDYELVEANSKLQLLSGIAGFALGIPAGLLSLLGSSSTVLVFAALVFAAGTVAAARISPEHGSFTPTAEAEAEAQGGVVGPGAGNQLVVRVASAAMSWLRTVVGLVTFALAFALRSPPPVPAVGESAGLRVGFAAPSIRVGTPPPLETGYPNWYFGAVVGASVIGGLLGSVIAPQLRAFAKEERIMFGCLLGAVAAGFCGLLFSGLLGMMLLALLVAISAGVAKQAFDSLVQAGAPDADRGRLFARFEARFQVVWVVGAVVAVMLSLSVGVAATLVLLGSVMAAGTYWTGWTRSGGVAVPRPTSIAGALRPQALVGGARRAFGSLWRVDGGDGR